MYSNSNDFRMTAAGGYEDESAEHMPMGDSITSLATVRPDMTQSFVDDSFRMDTYGPESLPSSSQPPSHSTETTTSGTSLEQDMEGFSSSYNNPSRASAGPSRGDFNGVGSWDHHQNLAPTSGDILFDGLGDETLPQPHAAQPRSARGSVTIVPRLASFHTHRRTMCPQRLQEAMQDIINAYNAHSTEQQCSPNQATQAKQGLSLFLDFFDRYYPGQQPSSIASSAKVDNYRCYTCGTKSTNRGTLKRHVSDKHYPQFEYFCPCCTVTQRRRDKIISHMRAHKGLHGESYIKRELPCPANCMICNLNTNNWHEFYQCFLKHSKIGGSSFQGAASRRSSADHGQGPPSHNGSGIAAQAVQNQLLSVPGSAPGGNSSPSTWSGSQPYHPPPAGMVRSRLENQTAKAREDSNPVPRSHHTTNKGKSPKRGKLSNPKHPRPPVSRGSSSQGTGSSGNAQEPKCTNCGHKFHECDETPFYGCLNIQSSKSRCHNCPGRQFIQPNVARPMATHQFSQSQPLPETNTYPWGTVNLAELEQTHRSFPPGPNMPLFPSGQQDPNFMPNHWMNVQRDLRDDLDDLSNVNSLEDLNDLHMFVVRDIDLPTLSEGELYSPLSVGSISPPSLTKLFSALSLKIPTGSPNKPLKGLPAIPSVWPYGGIEVSPWKELPPPVTSLKCNCACTTMPTISATKKTTDLPRGRRVEMSFSIAPNGPGSTLRNKVQIVVKLLGLRGATKKKVEAREAIEKAIEPTLGRVEAINPVENNEKDEDEDYSDVDSIFSHSSDASSSTDMSLYEDQTTVPSHRYSEVEFTFDFELESSLRRISQWTGVLAPDFVDWDSCGSEFLDVDRIVEFFFKYILYVIVVLGRSADHAFGSRLGD